MTREQTKIKGIYLSDGEIGGSLVTEFTASYADLVTLLGEPNSTGDEYKVSTEWNLELEDGTNFRIYDWKMTSLYDSDGLSVEDFRKLPSYEWHLGGPNDGWGGPTPAWARKVLGAISGAINEPFWRETGDSVVNEKESLMRSDVMLRTVCNVNRLRLRTRQYTQGIDEWTVTVESLNHEGRMAYNEAFTGTKEQTVSFVLGFAYGRSHMEDVMRLIDSEARKARESIEERIRPYQDDADDFARSLGKNKEQR